MPMSKTAWILTVGCGSLVLMMGITCLVLGLMGYFQFEDPCIIMKTFEIQDLQLGQSDSNEQQSSGNALMGALDTLTGGLASTLTPNQVAMTINVIMEVNNTNPFDLDYEQDGVGTIVIPADNITGLAEDLYIGDWTTPSGTLSKNGRNEIPVTADVVVDLSGPASTALTSNFVRGGPMSFRITGGLTGEGWVPGLSGVNTFVCMAQMENVLASGANVRCRHSTDVVGMNVDGTVEAQASFFQEQYVDPKCYV